MLLLCHFTGSPIPTESLLLDLLPISGPSAEVLRSIQTEIEKATILRTLYRRANEVTGRTEQVTIPTAAWDKVKTVSEEALAMLDANRDALTPVFREVDGAEVQIRREERAESKIALARKALKNMISATNERRPTRLLESQLDALYNLAAIGELLVPEFPFQITADESYDQIPRLLGRAVVEVTIRREVDQESPAMKDAMASSRNGKKFTPQVLGNLTVVVDGFSAPVTAGNFIDLCTRGFYNELPLRFNATEDAGSNLAMAIGGSYREGFVDPLTGKLRRLPLEILRSDPKKGDIPFYGAAQNTKIFTKSPVVQTFRIPGAIASNHPLNDGNGGSSEFFWLTDDNYDESGYFHVPDADLLDGNRYSIFGYVIRNLGLLESLSYIDGVTYIIEKTTVTYGEDNLLK
ncbi:unnamed protein product, partial [Chrysoparadoxa australica]